jgi:hypothetical protein
MQSSWMSDSWAFRGVRGIYRVVHRQLAPDERSNDVLVSFAYFVKSSNRLTSYAPGPLWSSSGEDLRARLLTSFSMLVNSSRRSAMHAGAR